MSREIWKGNGLVIYGNVERAVFVGRPNRFVAHCEMGGDLVVCHVKNTGRLKELLVGGAEVYLQRAENPNRSTLYDLIAVRKGERIINIDSQAPNRLFREWAEGGGVENLRLIRPESTYGNSRFDFYIETDERRMYVEVKGVTLLVDGVAMFPDAPTERGVKHLRELCQCVWDGYDAMAVFIIQMDGVRSFQPNDRTHPAFGDALREAQRQGVKLMALDCLVTPGTITANKPVEIRLSPAVL